NQRHNAQLAASALDGAVIMPGQVFSFNKLVPGWTADRGYRPAPVSYDGILVDDYGGGVCQTSTTVYNAALLAGLPILERHQHTFAPSYAPPGRDAAVAYSNVDLRFKNPFPWPITVHVGIDGAMLVCRIEGSGTTPDRAVVSAEVLDRFTPPVAIVQPGAGARRSRWRLQGRDGVRIAIYRDFYRGGRRVKRELVSDNTYRAISRARW
ncbi:MAG TPA: VanW family protein, partial [Armatimonadota bacterium]|nr:VanW family protein [Armatimonadota bacterium]